MEPRNGNRRNQKGENIFQQDPMQRGTWMVSTTSMVFLSMAALMFFSRKIMWLKLKRSNNNLVLPASYYLETESALKLCPTLWQTDCGNENNITAGIQCHIANDISAHMAPHKVSWIMVSFIQEIMYIWNVLGFHFLNYYKVN